MFDLRKQLVEDFGNYIRSFLRISDPQISSFVESEIERGSLWPEPLLQLNPSFAPGRIVDELVETGVVDHRCGTIFRRQKSAEKPDGFPLRLFKHQERAIQLAQDGRNYVLTTGTGSGKSLSYMLPIVDHVLRSGSGKGIKAVVVYPMNALANSQRNELEKYLGPRSSKPAVTFARYTGQESLEERDAITQNPPDIILTNYMMLELMLTRPYEQKLISAMSNLRFLVLDELHTYRGRQGADVALLVRRLRERSQSPNVQCVGTSATMATAGTAAERRSAVAEVASKLFGASVDSSDIVGETLLRWSPAADSADAMFIGEVQASLDMPPPEDLESFRNHPLTRWIESEIGLDVDDEGSLIRRTPRPLYGELGSAALLASQARIGLESAERALVAHLTAAADLPADPVSGSKVFPLRLHQFLSPGTGIFSTLGADDDRYLTLDGQKSDPNDPSRILFGLAFCRSCGQHYFTVSHGIDENGIERVTPRRLTGSITDEEWSEGYLYIPGDGRFPDLEGLIPEDWYDNRNGKRKLKRSKEPHIPKGLEVDSSGVIGNGVRAWILKAPFCLCVSCRESYSSRESDISKLSVLGLQGRSTATTTLSISTLNFLRNDDSLPISARKLLSFSDNRQDASLQSGHLNDFVEVGTLRAAIYAAALKSGDQGLPFDEVALRVEEELSLTQEEYARQPSNLPAQVNRRRSALRDVLGYRIYRDLRRGWRINAPNLEQVGLLRIDYPDLAFIVSDESLWGGVHQSLAEATPDQKSLICRELLERMRKKLAIAVRYLDPSKQEAIRNASEGLLLEPWALSTDDAAKMDTFNYAWLESVDGSDERSDILLTPRSGYAMFLRQPRVLPGGVTPKGEDLKKIIEDVVRILSSNGAALIRKVQFRNKEAYQLNADAFVWRASDPSQIPSRTRNEFFERFYRERAASLKGIRSREHTAQVAAKEREEREHAFRKGRLPILFCTPTMELGVDISDLNVVNLRNVPPTPANYAQRSGRAGRSGQPALVYSYCTAGSPHDQYYFRRQEQMVSGAVAPPKLDIANEDLVRAHVHAIWLGEAGLDLGSALSEKILDLEGEEPTLALTEEVQQTLSDALIRQKTKVRANAILEAIQPELERASWHSETWLDEVINQIPLSFDRACQRWRNLYRAALSQQKTQNAIAIDASSSDEIRSQAERLRREAETQLALLRDASHETQSDFYTYRYLASEGFLPGYNFPRLPLAAYLPGLRGKNEYLSRPRFLAISEFGPGAVVYHEGSRYLVERIQVPASARQDSGTLVTGVAKLCQSCGYLHETDETANVCEFCDSPLSEDSKIRHLFRLESVNLRRRDRITCDEEERMRQGYEIRTGLRFKGRAGNESSSAEVCLNGQAIARLTYSQAATIWRINVGWNRRMNKEQLGYQLDLDNGKWVPRPDDKQLLQDATEVTAKRVQTLVPFVEDRRNALVFEWLSPLSLEQHASLQSALKAAIQVTFQLEDSELAAEPLPSPAVRNSILFYESAEGGAGVLRRLVEDADGLRRVAQTALELCHFDASTLEDTKRGPKASADCSSACYDCLMSYGNQRDHLLLDRHQVKELLVALRDCSIQLSPTRQSRAEHLAELLKACDSELERDWLRFIDSQGLHLPSHAQKRIVECGTRPDFLYLSGSPTVAVYIDGPPHDFPSRQNRDAAQDFELLSRGWVVHRFHHVGDWKKIISENPSVYGSVE